MQSLTRRTTRVQTSPSVPGSLKLCCGARSRTIARDYNNIDTGKIRASRDYRGQVSTSRSNLEILNYEWMKEPKQVTCSLASVSGEQRGSGQFGFAGIPTHTQAGILIP